MPACSCSVVAAISPADRGQTMLRVSDEIPRPIGPPSRLRRTWLSARIRDV